MSKSSNVEAFMSTVKVLAQTAKISPCIVLAEGELCEHGSPTNGQAIIMGHIDKLLTMLLTAIFKCVSQLDDEDKAAALTTCIEMIKEKSRKIEYIKERTPNAH